MIENTTVDLKDIPDTKLTMIVFAMVASVLQNNGSIKISVVGSIAEIDIQSQTKDPAQLG